MPFGHRYVLQEIHKVNFGYRSGMYLYVLCVFGESFLENE